LDTYKFYESSLKQDINEFREILSTKSSLIYEHVIFNTDNEPIEKIPLNRSVYNVNIQKEVLFGRFKYDRINWGLDNNDEVKYLKIKEESEFCYFNELNTNWLIQFPTSKGRKELTWYFRNLFESKRPSVRSYKFPSTLIETLKSKYGWKPYVEELPQNEPHARRVRWVGEEVDKDPIYLLTRKRGSPTEEGILLIPENGWLIQISQSGSLKCFQDPYYETFINFIRKIIIPFV
jgi:hypothetical protein